ncbi:unnamed protein product [Periconia digitata]|uniref:Vacuolar ATPase assembly protein VMA22 n=1 Tax=Periconia digitata TaxID=1303443 RepID=A0A9W4UJK8_9PLEO|nr:unnamed protein product [Periconia digitata]
MVAAQDETVSRLKDDDIDKHELVQRLDELLEQYLHTVDAYQQAQQKLASHLSAVSDPIRTTPETRAKLTKTCPKGYIALAHANFNNASGTRYGQDFYDDRMSASRQMYVRTSHRTSLYDSPELQNSMIRPFHEFSVDVFAPLDPPNKEADQPKEKDQRGTRTHSSTVPAGFETATAPKDQAVEPGIENVLEPNHVVTRRDPIRWFGILVPSALRSAQSNFVSAVDGPLPQIATLSKDLRQQEIEIGRLRKQLKKI